MKSQVTFNFTVGHYQGTMSMVIRNGSNILLEKQEFENDRFDFTTYVDWPCVLEIDVANKGKFDTEVGPNGEILRDKYIKLDRLEVDRMAVHIVALLDMMNFRTEDQKNIKTNYWGFNGTVSLDFNGDDSFVWHLEKIRQVKKGDENSRSVRTEHQDNAGLGTIY